MQQRLFSTSELFPFRRFKKLFSFLPYHLFENKTYGRRPYPKEAILKAFIYGGLRRLNTLSEISFELSNNMNVAEDMGFNILKPLPSIVRIPILSGTPFRNLPAPHYDSIRHLIPITSGTPLRFYPAFFARKK